MSLEQPSDSREEREALAFLRRARKLRGLTPAQLQRIEHRLEQPARPRPSGVWRPALAALCLVLVVGGTAVARLADLSRLPLIGAIFSRHGALRDSRDDSRAETTPSPAPRGLPLVKSPPAPLEAVPDARPSIPPPPVAPRAAEGPPSNQSSRASPHRPALVRAPSDGAGLQASPTSMEKMPAGRLPDPLTEESRAFSLSLGKWHRDRDAEGALTALDVYEQRFPRGKLQLEARVLRAEILLEERREGEGLAALDQLTLSGLPRGRELETVRGELRVKHGRCAEGRRDLTDVLAKGASDGLGRRATRAIRLCP